MTDDLFPETKLKPEDDPNSRFTTREFMAWIKRTCFIELGLPSPDFEFDLDPFAHAESHWGRTWWTKVDNAYGRTMFGRAFVNGPWDECDDVVHWIQAQIVWNRALEFCAQVLPGNRQEQDWWQRWVEPVRDRRELRGSVVTSHYPPGRQAYGIPGAAQSTKWANGLNVNSLLLIWRTR